MKVSIIVPLYNSAAYLRDCIESIMMQRHIDLELIIVDNGSTDGSIDIVNEYIKRDSRIMFYKEEIKSPGAARNKGLNAARGEYFSFVDSDDYVSADYISKMLECMEKLQVDLVECGTVFMLESRNKLRNVTRKEERVTDGSQISGSVWGKLYKREVFGDIRFNHDRMGEDAAYTRKVLKKGARAAVCGYLLYGYRSYQDSITRLKPDRCFFSAIKNAEEEVFAEKTEEMLDAVGHRREAAVYIRELIRLKRLWKDRDMNTERLDRMINENGTPLPVYLLLRLKMRVNRVMAFIKVHTGYKYVLD